MIDLFHRRLSALEYMVHKPQTAPTFPIYNVTDLPQDAVDGQIAIGLDNSINWFSNNLWYSLIGEKSIVGDIPQDTVNGQIVIGLDNGLHWKIGDTWFGIPSSEIPVIGNPPQDAIEGQIVVNGSSICWFSNSQWYGNSVN